MGNFSDEELKKWLAEEYNKEIDEMEKIMFPDGNIPDDGETEEEARAAYARLVERLKADGIYEEENDSENADDHKENNEKTEEAEKVKIVYLPAKPKKRNRIARVAAAVLVCAAGVFAASMTSQANRSYFIDSVKFWTGNDTSISVDNNVENELLGENETEAINSIKTQLNIDVPQFVYRPEELKFLDYTMSNKLGYVLMEYEYKENILSIYINQYTENSKSSDLNFDGKIIKSIKLKDEGTKIEIRKIQSETDIRPSYMASWKDGSRIYQISCRMNEEEFVKLIEGIRF